MSIYLIDYENVNAAGIEGIRNLKQDDQVHIFYSEQIKTIPFDKSIEMAQSKAKLEFIEMKKVGKNYLDFQLATYLGYLIGKGEKGFVYIISKDTGFDSIVDFWKGRNINICRQESIEKKAQIKQQKKKKEKITSVASFPETYRKKVRAAVKKEKLSPSAYTTIYKAIAESKDKLELNNALVKSFDSAKGGSIYNQVKEIFEEYKSKL